MKYSHHCVNAFAAVLCAAFPALAVAPAAAADPAGDASVEAPAAPTEPAAAQVVSADAPGPAAAIDAVQSACRQFGAAINVAASNYEDFAYATAGGGNTVNYQDPNVVQSNLVGRTALRVAAGAAMEAAGTPGLPPDIADPMRSWSLHATKLLLIMGLRGGGNSLNAAATQLNADAHDAQMACALNGGQA